MQPIIWGSGEDEIRKGCVSRRVPHWWESEKVRGQAEEASSPALSLTDRGAVGNRLGLPKPVFSSVIRAAEV